MQSHNGTLFIRKKKLSTDIMCDPYSLLPGECQFHILCESIYRTCLRLGDRTSIPFFSELVGGNVRRGET